MAVPDREIAAVRDAHRRLLATVEQLTEDDLRRPSLLPGWTVAHVLAHLARNADSVVRRLEGARRDELVPQYEGGPAGRAAEIERDVQRPAEVVIADLLRTSDAVDDALADAFVRRFLPEVLCSLEAPADPRALLAWGLGRSAPPPLAPWG